MNVEYQVILGKMLNAAITIAIGVLVYFILKQIVHQTLSRSESKLNDRQAQRVRTLRTLIQSAIRYVVIIGVGIALLATFGIDVTSLLAGLGIATAIVGLAFQDLAKDIIAGISIITDAKYEVGDLIEVNGFKGRVTAVSLKTTRIKNYRGKEKIISNRTVDEVINYSTHDSLAEVDVMVGYEHSRDQVMKALEKVKENLDGKLEDMTGEINIYGITEFGDSGVGYRLTCNCAPYKHFGVQREIRNEIKAVFDKARINIPYKQIDIHTKH